MGDQGDQGDKGPLGDKGLKGNAGAQGIVGKPGASGAVGPQGLPGKAGMDGATGPQGPVGLSGAIGAQGPMGATGPQGPPGAAGAMGPTGMAGPAGPQGPLGPEGNPGLDCGPILSNFDVTNYVIDQTTNQPFLHLNDITLKLVNTINQQTYYASYDGATGLFTFSQVNFGSYTVTVTSTQTTTFSATWTINGPVTSNMLSYRVFLLPITVGNNVWRAVLTWGESPADLDFHCYYPGNVEIVQFTHKMGNDGKVNLNYDARPATGYGPEVLTINFDLTGSNVYRVFVYNYSTSPPINYLGKAQVLLYQGATLYSTINIPSSYSDFNWWHVFDLGASGATIFNQITSTDQTETATTQTTAYSVSGQLINATTNVNYTGLTNVTITFTSTTATIGGNPVVVHCQYTPTTGAYKCDGLVPDTYNVTFSADQITTYSNSFAVFNTITDVRAYNPICSPSITGSIMRAVVTWNNEPQDLDSYLITPTEEICYGWRTSSDGVITLDIDQQFGFGPETITMQHGPTGSDVWRYLINNWSDEKTLYQSGGHVVLYRTAGNLTWDVPTDPSAGNALWWHVFKIDSTGVTGLNTLRNDSNPY